MRILIRLVFALMMLFSLVACAADATPAPTIAPTDTAFPPTLTLEPTLTPRPTRIVPTDIPLPRTIAENSARQSYLRFIHATSSIEAVDFDINGLMLAVGLEYGRFTQPTPLVNGLYTLNISLNEADEASPLLQKAIDLPPGQTWLVILTGTLESPSLLIRPEEVGPLPEGESAVQVVNMLPGADGLVAEFNGGLLAGPLNAMTFSSFAPLTPGDGIFNVRIGDAQLITDAIGFREMRRHIVIVSGDLADAESWRLIVIDTRVPAQSFMRVIHALPEIGTVDVYLGNEPLLESFGSLAVSERMIVGGRNQIVALYSPGTSPLDGEPVASAPVNVNPGEPVTMVITGNVSRVDFALITDDLSPVDADKSRLTILNAAPRATRLSYGLSFEEVGIRPVDYLDTSIDFEMLAGAYDLSFDSISLNDETNEIEYAAGLLFEAGRSYLYVVTGLGEEVPSLIYSEEVGFTSPDQGIIGAERTDEDADPPGLSRVRFVNAIEGGFGVDIAIDDVVIVDGILPGESNPFLILTEGEHTISLRDPETGDDLYVTGFEFNANTDYSMYAHGFDSESLYEITQVADFNVVRSTSTAALRLVNLSFDTYNEFGLGFLPSSGNPVIQPFTREDGSIGRPSIFLELNRLLDAVEGGAASQTVVIPPGETELHVIDPANDTLALGIGPVTMNLNAYYDVIVYQFTDSLLLKGFVIEYLAQ